MVNDMTKGRPAKVFSIFAIPLIFGTLFQQLYNIVDLIIIGRFAGSESLAAIGNTTYLSFLFVAFASGISSGITVVVANHVGEKSLRKINSSIWTSFIMFLGAGIIILGVGLALNHKFMLLINTPVEIIMLSEAYFSRYLIGIPFLFLFNVCSALFQALGDSKSSFLILLISTGINILLDLLFVAKMGMGVEGAADATIIAEFFSLIIGLCILYKYLKQLNLECMDITFDKKELLDILGIGIPSAVQMAAISIANLILQPLINSFGTLVVAAVTAAFRIDSIARSPMGAVSNALSSYTAQNIGAGKKERIVQGLRVSLFWDCVISALVALLIIFYGKEMLGFFVSDEISNNVIAIGMSYLNVLAVFFIIQGAMNAFNGVFRGIRNVKAFFLSMTINMACRVIVAYTLVLVCHSGYFGIWVATPIGWIVGFIINCFYYHRDKKNGWEIKGRSNHHESCID